MKRLRALLLFLVPFVAILAAGHVYLAKRLILDAGVPSPFREALLATVAALGVSLLWRIIGKWILALRLGATSAAIAYVWLGLLWILFVVTVAAELPAWLLGLSEGTRAALIFAVAAGVALSGIAAALRTPRVRRVEVALERWPRALDGFRIAQLSDVHIGPFLRRRFAERLTANVNAVGADLIAITGDVVDGSVEELAAEVAPLAGLRARHGVYVVSGNHDYLSGADPWCERFASLGFEVLRNRRVVIGEPSASFELAGVDDHHGRFFQSGSGEDLERAIGGRDGAMPLVLLAHQPNTFAAARRMGVDLQLSGHTHGGQIWPFVHLVRLSVPWIAGLYRDGAAQLYVSRGTGFWGPPMRVFAPAEITELVLRAR